MVMETRPPMSNGALTELRKTCDECQSIKVRCDPMPEGSTSSTSSSLDGPNAPPTCRRCHRLGLHCVYSPKIKVIKRKRRKASMGERSLPSPPQPANANSANANVNVNNSSSSSSSMAFLTHHQPFAGAAPTMAVPSHGSPPAPQALLGDSSLAPPPPPQYPQRQQQQQQQHHGQQQQRAANGVNNEEWTDFFRWPDPPATPDFGAAPWEDWFRSLGPTSTTNTPGMDQNHSASHNGAGLSSFNVGAGINLGGLGGDPTAFMGCHPALHATPRTLEATTGMSNQTTMQSSPPPPAESTMPKLTRINSTMSFDGRDDGRQSHQSRGGPTPQAPSPSMRANLAASPINASSTAPAKPTSKAAAAAPHSCGSTSAASLADFRPSNLEIRLSAISAGLSTALDDCDIDRILGSGLTRRQARRRRVEAERKLLMLLVEADDVWREINRLGAARMKEVEALIASDPRPEASSSSTEGEANGASSSSSSASNADRPVALGCGHNHERVGGGTIPTATVTIKERMYALGKGSLVEPIRVTTSMLALSLSYQVCDALRLISRLLDQAGEYQGNYHDEADGSGDADADDGEEEGAENDEAGTEDNRSPGDAASVATAEDPAVEAARRLANIISPVLIAGRALPPSLHRPLVASLWTHHGESLLASLVSTISHSQDWHHLGEGQGKGPHSFCAMQTQGARVVSSLEALIQTRRGEDCCAALKRKRAEE
ncbi:hypothetical protein BDZ90DRAFT_230453 [Jaminaea rosea]|uniref:Zn(2)-C6 fungal-type domain-containing protein n=1 Tax=Jaminaea rosea TaxID=1569628 RepID=A0A316UZ50_9BASI|nr:hypothetical protein BDZ90DRAFT_230453 [Jaminaea rosea]PWN29591.1 hypothetical protein BDZ90DRAFT_230453 [Jaminaea rosea]